MSQVGEKCIVPRYWPLSELISVCGGFSRLIADFLNLALPFADSVRIRCGFPHFGFNCVAPLSNFFRVFCFFFVIFFGYRSARPGRMNAD